MEWISYDSELILFSQLQQGESGTANRFVEIIESAESDYQVSQVIFSINLIVTNQYYFLTKAKPDLHNTTFYMQLKVYTIKSSCRSVVY